MRITKYLIVTILFGFEEIGKVIPDLSFGNSTKSA
jgi:hypothetical protein